MQSHSEFGFLFCLFELNLNRGQPCLLAVFESAEREPVGSVDEFIFAAAHYFAALAYNGVVESAAGTNVVIHIADTVVAHVLSKHPIARESGNEPAIVELFCRHRNGLGKRGLS